MKITNKNNSPIELQYFFKKFEEMPN